MSNKYLKVRILSSLEKVFADEELTKSEWKKGTMLCNEVYSFQVAYYWTNNMLKDVKVHINSELDPWITVRMVGLIPSEMPCYGDHDEDIIRSTPGLYSDALMDLEDSITLLPKQWRSLWVSVDPQENMKAGKYPIEITFNQSTGEELGKVVFELEVLEATLPQQKLIHTEWFHTDCIATYYNVEVFSEEHWKRIEQFIYTAVRNGINMILTPLFTPPLDTDIGGERPTVQLVDVEKYGNEYTFIFDKLKRWIEMCRSNGVLYFEFSHLFTQWGAKHAPKIMATEGGVKKQIFGWDTDATGEAYKVFLSQFLPQLVHFIKENNLDDSSYFHVSDEPSIEHLENYRSASAIICEYLEEYPVIDALSNYEFYETGIVNNPIPASNHIQPFLENQSLDNWTYYCCGQYQKVSNRFFNMPSSRNRIIGMQLYKFNIRGFLHWGYNFWYSQYSKGALNPFKVTDAMLGFPSGDAFVVYPGDHGPIESLRLKVFFEALQDLRALTRLEELIGREAVLEFLEEDLDEPITFEEYPKDAEWILSKREAINRKIIEASEIYNISR